MCEIFHQIYQDLLNGQELAVATIISDKGSTPRSSGSKMIVYPNGDIYGTIGGGVVEGEVIQRALHLIKTKGAEIVSYDLNQGANLDQMDVICGGWIKVFIEYVEVNENNIDLYRSAQEEIKRSRPFFWVGKVVEERGQWSVEHALLKPGNEFIGPVQIKHEFQKLVASNNPMLKGPCWIDVDGDRYIIESVKPMERLFLFGAGHVAKEIAALSKRVGFQVIVFDDRVEFANANNFPDAYKTIVCPEYAEVFNGFNTTPNDFIVIVTRGHRFDKTVLAQALKTQACYIGMIGSTRKRDKTYKQLIHEGADPSALEQVCCPVGLSIDAETPAEIAVSVVAQLIEQRSIKRSSKIHGQK